MKKLLSLILGIIFIVTLTGCSNATRNVSTQPNSSLSSETPKKNKYTKDDAVSTFKTYKDLNNYEIIDYVPVDDNKIPMLKAVISFYDKQRNNSCNLAFIFGDSSQEICFAANELDGVRSFEIADNSHLIYVGDGMVATSIRKINTSELIDYRIIFSHEKSTSASNFKVVSKKRTK